MNNICKQNILNTIVFKLQTIYWYPQRSYYLSVQGATGLQFYYVIPDPKVAE